MVNVKMTVSLPQESINALDEIKREGLHGSRGRAIQALVKEHKEARKA